MPLDEPSWWYKTPNTLVSHALKPAASVYAWMAKRRYDRIKPYSSRLPVICIGNFTAGGTGKTPLALHICEELKSDGEHPVFLTRGFNGRLEGPVWVDTDKHTALDVGDEPLLLARAAPTLVARDRAQGAKFIESGGKRASVIVMDDGLQNPSLEKDLTFAVIDAKRALGNTNVIPAGPLRAPLDFQLPLVDAIVVNKGAPENENTAPTPRAKSPTLENHLRAFRGPVLDANVSARADTAWLAQAPVIAFAGIANPARFFSMLEIAGANVVSRKVFPDHHNFSEDDAAAILKQSFDRGARLLTTEKDLVRLSGHSGHRGELHSTATAFPIKLHFSPSDDVRIDELLKNIPGRGVHGANP